MPSAPSVAKVKCPQCGHHLADLLPNDTGVGLAHCGWTIRVERTEGLKVVNSR